MNRRIILPTFLLLFVCASSVSAQMTVAGEVIEVVDGKTVIISIPTGKVKAELQFVEVPEEGQPYHEIVKEHLSVMVLGKVVEYRAQTIFKNRTVGRMLLNGVDVSQQLLRDGAAWHIPANVSGQGRFEFDIYSSTEKEARDEKRGVWSIAGLKPAWEVRAERAAAARATPSNNSSLSTGPQSANPITIAKVGYWGDKNPALTNIGALANGYNAETKRGYVGTSYLGVPETDLDKAIGAKTAVDISYFYKEDEKNVRKGLYVITVLSASTKWRFLAHNDLYVINDGKSTFIGKAKRASRTVDGAVQETLSYTVNRSAVETVANGSEVILKVGDYSCRPLPMLQYMLFNLLQVSQ